MMRPKLRFKEFTDEWQQTTLSNFFDISAGGDIEKNHVSEYKTDTFIYPIYANALTNNGLYGYSDIYKIDGKTITVTGRGDVGKAIARNGKYYPIVRLLVLKSNREFNNIFFENAINNIKLFQESTGVPQLTSPQLGKYDVFFPGILEQDKIASLLSLLDKKIELQSKKIEDLKLFKLSQLNLIKIGDSYKKIFLKEILKECNEKTTINNQYDILSSTAKGIFLQSEYFNKQAASENNIGYKILRRNQLVLSPQNLWMGNININMKYEIGIVSPSYKIFDINTDEIDIEYFKNWIKSSRALYEYMISSEQGASIVRRNLNMELFGEITLSIPNMDEQNKIGKMLFLIDNKILLEEDRYKKLVELKKGLMQNMFV